MPTTWSSTTTGAAEPGLRAARWEFLTDALAAAGSALGIAIAQIGNLLDIGQVLLGGIYGPLYPYLLPTISRELGERLIAADWASIDVRPATLGPEAAVIGAALVGVEWVLAEPAAFV